LEINISFIVGSISLNEIIFALEWIIDEDWKKHKIEHPDNKWKGTRPSHPFDWEKLKEVENRAQKGLELFGKHFQSLWD